VGGAAHQGDASQSEQLSMSDSQSATDPFAAFWTDWMSRMGGSATKSTSETPEAVKQMRQMFFDAWAKYAEQFMRSEQFLSAMKQSMDNALAFRQQLDQFLTQGVRNMQMPARGDTDHIVMLLRSLEDRVMSRLDDLDARITAVESGRPSQPTKVRSSARSPKTKRRR
jgi:hypothetical protein